MQARLNLRRECLALATPIKGSQESHQCRTNSTIQNQHIEMVLICVSLYPRRHIGRSGRFEHVLKKKHFLGDF